MKRKKELPVLIGLCGRSGSGKGVVSSYFAEFGIPSVDTDKIYHEMTGPRPAGKKRTPCMERIVRRFGEEIENPDGSLNRKALAEIVFGEDGGEALSDLNGITHRAILSEAEERAAGLRKKGYPIVIIDAPLLFESGYDKKCDMIIAASAPVPVLTRRIADRDGITLAAARRRLASQRKIKKSEVDAVIDTHRPFEEIRETVRLMAEEIKERFT